MDATGLPRKLVQTNDGLRKLTIPTHIIRFWRNQGLSEREVKLTWDDKGVLTVRPVPQGEETLHAAATAEVSDVAEAAV